MRLSLERRTYLQISKVLICIGKCRPKGDRIKAASMGSLRLQGGFSKEWSPNSLCIAKDAPGSRGLQGWTEQMGMESSPVSIPPSVGCQGHPS